MTTKHIAMELGNALESLQREPQPDAFVANVALEAQEEIARLQAQVAESQRQSDALLARGLDYCDKIETLQAQVDALADATQLLMVGYRLKGWEGDHAYIQATAALAAVGRLSPERAPDPDPCAL